MKGNSMEQQIKRGRAILIAVAMAGKTITYKAFARKLRIHWRGNMRHLLGEISLAEVAVGRPPVSAVVVYGHPSHGHKAGPGFINLCGRIKGMKLDWRYQLGRVHGYWAR